MSNEDAVKLCNHVRCCYYKPDGYMFQYPTIMADIWVKVFAQYDYNEAHSALVGLIQTKKSEPTIEDLIIAITERRKSPFE